MELYILFQFDQKLCIYQCGANWLNLALHAATFRERDGMLNGLCEFDFALCVCVSKCKWTMSFPEKDDFVFYILCFPDSSPCLVGVSCCCVCLQIFIPQTDSRLFPENGFFERFHFVHKMGPSHFLVNLGNISWKIESCGDKQDRIWQRCSAFSKMLYKHTLPCQLCS